MKDASTIEHLVNDETTNIPAIKLIYPSYDLNSEYVVITDIQHRV